MMQFDNSGPPARATLFAFLSQTLILVSSAVCSFTQLLLQHCNRGAHVAARAPGRWISLQR